MTLTMSLADQVSRSVPENAMLLSVAIISFNEESNIGRCLEAVRDLATEIIVVDSHSTDKTVEIARNFGSKVYIEDWKGYVDQKNSALDKCVCEWILFLDCDEVVSPELKDSLLMTMMNPKAVGYKLNRKTFFLGRWIKYAWYPDWNTRLIRQNTGRWQGLDVHENLATSGSIGKLEGDLQHYSFRDIRDCLERQVRYSLIAADSYYREGRRASLTKLVVNPLHSFFKHYVIKRGFLDGQHGFIISVLSGIYVFFKYLLLWEKQREQKDGNR